MKHSIKKLICLNVAICIVLSLLMSAVCADGATYWDCTNCGQKNNRGNYCSNCGAARPSGGMSYSDENLERIPGESNKVKVNVESVSANSYIVNHNDPNLWLPWHAADGDESTCWQFSSQNNALGNVYLDLDLSAPQAIDAIWIKNGFWAYSSSGTDLYTANCRPKQVQVEFYYANSYQYSDTVTLNLKDDTVRRGWQKFDVGRHENVMGVRLWVLSAYTGSMYKYDVCLSEVMLVQNRSASGIQPSGQTSGGNGGGGSTSNGVQANLLMRLSTRSGPGTQYDEPGTFFQNNWQTTTVNVLGKAWDGNIWWVLVDFNYGSASYRVWTGLKRVDVNIDALPEITKKGMGVIYPTDTRRGPGANYAKGPTISTTVDAFGIIGSENGYVEVDYLNQDENRWYRFWVPENKVKIDPPSGPVGN